MIGRTDAAPASAASNDAATAASRRLGADGPRCAPIALGCFSMSHAYGPRSDAESKAVIGRAIDAGLTLVDTADFYGWGHNESLVGEAIRSRRDQVLLSSKFGYVRSPDPAAPFALCSTPAHVRAACEASLRRLGTDRLDLYFQHRLDPQVPIEETVGAMAELVREGKVEWLGLCEVSERTLRRACAVHPIAAVQLEYSLWTRDAEASMLDTLDALSVTPMAFSPLGRGMLTGRLRRLDQLAPDDVRRKYPRFSAGNFPLNVALIDRFGEIAASLGCTNSQLAIAWLLAKRPTLIPVCGCDTLEFLDENLGALGLVLDAPTVARIDSMFAPGAVRGDRYHAALMRMIDRA